MSTNKIEYKVRNIYKLLVIRFVDFVLNLVLKRKRKTSPNKINKILIIRLDNIGDILLTRPLIYSLSKAYPDAKIDVLLKGDAVNIIKNDTFIHNVFFYSKAMIKAFRKKKYDLLIEPKGRLDYAFLAWKIKPSFSIGFGDAGGGAFFDVSLFRVDQNPIAKNRMISEKLAVEYLESFPEIQLAKELVAKYKKYQEFIVINPFTSRKDKDWNLDNFVSLAKLLRDTGHQVIFLAEKNKEADLADYLVESKEYLLFSKEELFDYVSVIKNAKLLIAPDSASIHIAVAVGTKSIALYGLEDPLVWHPYDADEHVYIRKSYNVNDIQIVDVLDKVKDILVR